MTHFFYSLRREISEEEKGFIFYFDTHIITQVNLELKHTFFDKVSKTLRYNSLFLNAKISAIGGTFGLFCGLSLISGIEFFFYLSIMVTGFVKKKMCQSGRIKHISDY